MDDIEKQAAELEALKARVEAAEAETAKAKAEAEAAKNDPTIKERLDRAAALELEVRNNKLTSEFKDVDLTLIPEGLDYDQAKEYAGKIQAAIDARAPKKEEEPKKEEPVVIDTKKEKSRWDAVAPVTGGPAFQPEEKVKMAQEVLDNAKNGNVDKTIAGTIALQAHKLRAMFPGTFGKG